MKYARNALKIIANDREGVGAGGRRWTGERRENPRLFICFPIACLYNYDLNLLCGQSMKMRHGIPRTREVTNWDFPWENRAGKSVSARLRYYIVVVKFNNTRSARVEFTFECSQRRMLTKTYSPDQKITLKSAASEFEFKFKFESKTKSIWFQYFQRQYGKEAPRSGFWAAGTFLSKRKVSLPINDVESIS